MDHFNRYDNLPRIIAHRGASGCAPENTLAAFKQAKQFGATWIETDARLTADHKLVVYHDPVLGRTASGKGAISEHKLDDLVGLDAGAWFAPEFSGETILSIEELFEHCNVLGLGINLEVKCASASGIIPLVEALEKFLKSYSNFIPLEISSFNFEVLYLLAQKIPTLRYGVLFYGANSALAETGFWKPLLASMNAYAFHVHRNQVSKKLIDDVHALGYKFLVYTVNDVNEAERMFDWGVDSICTDFPERLLAKLH